MIDLRIQIPEILLGRIKLSDLYGAYTAKNELVSYNVDLEFGELNLCKKLKASTPKELKRKVDITLSNWAKDYERHSSKLDLNSNIAKVDKMNRKINEKIQSLGEILKNALIRDQKLDWNYLKQKKPFIFNLNKHVEPSSEIHNFIDFNEAGKPAFLHTKSMHCQPDKDRIANNYSITEKFFHSNDIQKEYDKKMAEWEEEKKLLDIENRERTDIYNGLMKAYEADKWKHDKEEEGKAKILESLKIRCLKNDVDAIEKYFDKIINASPYTDEFPSNWKLEYNPENKSLIFQMYLLTPSDIPNVRSYEYIKSRDAIAENKLNYSARYKIYDSAIYQTCIRAIYEIFESDITNFVQSMIFNGSVTLRNSETGEVSDITIVSISTTKKAFGELDLANTYPEDIFKMLKATCGANLHELTPVKPIALPKARPKQEYINVYDDPDARADLITLPWEHFDQLVRDTFAKEFSSEGIEVNIIHSSEEAGINATVIDPDPMRGGKLVIQMIRTSEAVSVVAVSELYELLLEEEADKGILLTTTDYDVDSYDYIKGKPITLLRADDLLTLFEKHGFKVQIILEPEEEKSDNLFDFIRNNRLS